MATPMPSSAFFGARFRSRIGILLWIFGGGVSISTAAGRPETNAPPVHIVNEPVRLPIFDATDNRFRHLSTGDAVSPTKVDSIQQDDSGFMWFATHYGLYRYDGYAFRAF